MIRSTTPVRDEEAEGDAEEATGGEELKRLSRATQTGVAKRRGMGVLDGMDAPSTSSLIPIIQVSTTPVILISGMGLLLLTMTNRMGRIIDRTRLYAAQLRDAAPEQKAPLEAQLEITWQRAKLVRLALTAATASMLAAAGLVIVIFLGAMLHRELNGLVLFFFGATILLLVIALAAFLRDIFVSLTALRLEMEQARRR
jgi:hypothetical protein